MRLSTRQADGCTLREHLEAAVRAGSKVPPELAARVPAGGALLWSAFVDLAAARPAGMGAAAVPPSEVLAWQQLHGVRLAPWDVDTLMRMDRAALAVPRPAAAAQGG